MPSIRDLLADKIDQGLEKIKDNPKFKNPKGPQAMKELAKDIMDEAMGTLHSFAADQQKKINQMREEVEGIAKAGEETLAKIKVEKVAISEAAQKAAKDAANKSAGDTMSIIKTLADSHSKVIMDGFNNNATNLGHKLVGEVREHINEFRADTKTLGGSLEELRNHITAARNTFEQSKAEAIEKIGNLDEVALDTLRGMRASIMEEMKEELQRNLVSFVIGAVVAWVRKLVSKKQEALNGPDDPWRINKDKGNIQDGHSGAGLPDGGSKVLPERTEPDVSAEKTSGQSGDGQDKGNT